MNLYRSIINFIPGILIIPFYIGSFLYFILLPDITYYALGIYLDIWIPSLRTFWGFPILFILICIPFVNVILLWLLTFQSFWALFKFVIGSYYPTDQLLGFVTMYPATVVIISYTVAYVISRSENNPTRTSSTGEGIPLPRDEGIPDLNQRREDSTAARAVRETRSSDAKTRGASSTAAKAARAASSSDTKSRSEESTAVKAARAASSTSTSASDTEDLYFDNIKESHKEKPSKDSSNKDDDDDLYFDNTEKK